MAGFHKKGLYRGCQKLSAPQTTTCTLADTYYKIAGTWGGSLCKGFERDGTGKITYKGPSGVTYLFNGTSDVKTDTAGKVTYGLYLNGALVTGAETPHDFTAAAKTENIAITSFPAFNYGDEIEVYCKHSTAGSDVISDSLIITFLGEI